MKKYLIVLFVLLLVLTGCGKAKEMNTDKNLVEQISSLGTGETKEFEGVMVISDNTLETEFGLTKEDVSYYVGQASGDSKFYLVVKPQSDRKERVQNQLNVYIRNIKDKLEMNLKQENLEEEEKTELNSELAIIKGMVQEEYNGYLIYISSSNNEQILQLIKGSLK